MATILSVLLMTGWIEGSQCECADRITKKLEGRRYLFHPLLLHNLKTTPYSPRYTHLPMTQREKRREKLSVRKKACSVVINIISLITTGPWTLLRFFPLHSSRSQTHPPSPSALLFTLSCSPFPHHFSFQLTHHFCCPALLLPTSSTPTSPWQWEL